MKKTATLIALGFILLVILISVIPDYKASQRPFNKLSTYAKAEGFALGVLLTDPSQIGSTESEIARLEALVKRKIPTRFFTGKESLSISAEQAVAVPGFVLMDGDGKLAAKEGGVIKAENLVKYFMDLHTH
jgi:hypothetical protein